MTTAVLPARPEAGEFAPYYGGYIAQVPDGELLPLLEQQIRETLALLAPLPPERAAYRYAPGKWSVAEIVGHLADAERIFTHRALRAARGDETPLPGFDENAYVPAGEFDRRPLGELLAELEAVRRSTLCLLHGLPPDAWTRRVTANNHPVSVRALAYVIAGHERHHVRVLRERYGVGG